MIKIGYKVVSSNLKSAVVYNPGTTTYEVGKSTRPRPECGPLTVFTSLYGAAYFKEQLSPPLRIFKCCYIPSQIRSVWISEYESFPRLEVPIEQLIAVNFDCIVPGSVDLADEVVLVEEV